MGVGVGVGVGVVGVERVVERVVVEKVVVEKAVVENVERNKQINFIWKPIPVPASTS